MIINQFKFRFCVFRFARLFIAPEENPIFGLYVRFGSLFIRDTLEVPSTMWQSSSINFHRLRLSVKSLLCECLRGASKLWCSHVAIRRGNFSCLNSSNQTLNYSFLKLRFQIDNKNAKFLVFLIRVSLILLWTLVHQGKWFYFFVEIKQTIKEKLIMRGLYVPL